jgi:hypothetical protein
MATLRTRSTLEQLRDDPTAPAIVRSTVTDWLERTERGRIAHDTMRAELERALQTERDILRTAPDTIVAMLAADKFTPAKVAPGLEQARTAVAAAETLTMLTRQAHQRAEHTAHRCYLAHRAELVPWIAQHRVAVPLAGQIPRHVAAVCETIRPHIEYPIETWLDPDGVMVSIPRNRNTITLGPDDRSYWAWCAIAAGLYATDTHPNTGHPVFRITTPWATRALLVAEYGTRPTPNPARPRTAPHGSTVTVWSHR